MRGSRLTIKLRIIASMVAVLVVSMVLVVWYITSRNAADARKVGFAYAEEVATSQARQVESEIAAGLSTSRDLAHILAATPGTTGVVLDLPHVVAEAGRRLAGYGLGDRLSLEPGDFFTAVPAGADTYLLSMILHDWSDAEASRLLGRIKAAAPAGAQLVAFELVVPDGSEPHMAKMIDLTMLGMLSGRERTREEHRVLLQEERAGVEIKVAAAALKEVLDADKS